MRRKYVLACALMLLAGSLAAAWIVRPAHAPPLQQIVAKTAAENQPNLPLSQVVLFSSGVGYFQREGDVEGSARVDMQFPIGDINDLLKSVVLQDLGKGKIGIISYDGLDPVDKTLRSFAVDLTGNPTVGQLLNQARGEKVEVVMQSTAANQPGTVTGVVMGMESEMQPHGPSAVHEVHLLNLVCAEGMRSVNLREVQRIRFLNPKLEGELRKALDVVATTHDSLKKQVSLNFKGDGKRKVRVGYVAENPIWKTSYRLSVDDVKGQARPKVQLQGWAAVENVTDEDWNDVRVVLVAGRPISFQMDMYPPLFVPRPTVEPERFASLRPPNYGGALTRGKIDEMMAGALNPPAPQLPPGALGLGGGLGGIGGLGGGIGGGGSNQPTTNLGWQGNLGNVGFIGGGFQGQVNIPTNRYQNPRRRTPEPGMMGDDENTELTRPGSRLSYDQLKQRREQQRQQMEQVKGEAKAAGEKITRVDPHGQLATEAAAEDLGTVVRYVIDERVSLPRQKSALLPLLDKPIDARRVSIYTAPVNAGLVARLNAPMQPEVATETELTLGDWLDLVRDNLRVTGCVVFPNAESLRADPPVRTSGNESPRIKIPSMPGATLDGVLTRVLSQIGLTYVVGTDRIEILKRSHDRRRAAFRVEDGEERTHTAKGVESKHPVLGLRVRNNTGRSLTEGPVTVYEDGSYAGDAQLPDMQPAEERLAAYAVDLGVEVKSETRLGEGPAVTASVVGNHLHLHYTNRQTRKYLIRNRSPHERLLVIEHPVREGWELAAGMKPRETSRDFYRFDVPVAAGAEAALEIAEEQPRIEELAEQNWVERDGQRVMQFAAGVGLRVEVTGREDAAELVRVQVAKGDIVVTSRERVRQAYRIVNDAPKEARDVTLRYRAREGWRIAGEMPADVKDFVLKLAPGKEGRAEVVTEREGKTAFPATTATAGYLEKLVKDPATSAAAKAALTKVLEWRTAVDVHRAQSAEVERRLKEIAEEQDRLRKNLANLPPTSAAHKRYLEKFDKQETEIEGLQEQLKRLKEAEKQKQKELIELLPTLNAE